ncbi:PA2169 family four-helix-bundle protein [uncultured Maribacter sp.]|uniref:ferritin-like domain-containing protein n=1 Tax=uncultured Maribacter sp. TaxID=431308 RepID=UPI0026274C2A|nr:PA2169 family four-helix-bundle protein [uncultured Maribacter sp.]
MNTYREAIGNKLNNLLEKTYDAEKGFKKAAEKTNNAFLKGYFDRKTKERYNFGQELKTEIKAYGQEVETGDSMAAKAHRTWIDIKTLFATDNEEAILEEAIRGEKAAVKEYTEVLNDTTLPPSTAHVLGKQKKAIEIGITNIKTLEDLA